MPASPLLLLVPYRYKAAVLYSQIPISASASGDFVVSRAGNTASRILGNGNIETGVLANIARINYPRTGVASGCAGLLVEPSGTNTCLQSEAWNVSPWVATSGSQGATVSGNVTASPDGTTNADKLIEAAVTGNHFCLQNFTLTSGTTYTASFFVKASERTRGVLRTSSGLGIYWDMEFNLTSGTVTGGTNPFIQNFGNGWYRIGATFTANQASNNFILYLIDASGTASYTGDGTSGLFVFGAQVEVGSVATSYIPTTTAAVTRNSDVITNNQFVIPNLIGAILTEFESPTSGTYFVDNLPVTLVSGYNKVAISYTPTTITVYRNGTQVSGSPFSPPGGVLPIIGNVINIGHNNQYYQLGANIRSFVLYSSTLTAAEASGLTS